MAAGLHLSGEDSAQAILEYCRKRVAALLKGVKDLRSITDIERVICDKLNLVIHEIWNDEELERFSRQYVAEGDAKLAALDMELEREDSFGVIYERNVLNESGELQYVAFVDCRGKKEQRRFFTRWHEIAHRLTAYQQFEMPFFRVISDDVEKEPLEQLMDKIAGEVGFWDPMFRPLLNRELGKAPLTFEVVENIRTQFCFDASFRATLNACAGRSSKPVVILDIELAYKNNERELLNRLGERAKQFVKPSLRVVQSMPNQAARDGRLYIHKKRRIPPCSIIAKLHSSKDSDFAEGQENLSTWIDSEGKSLADVEVYVQARKFNEHIVAIVTIADNAQTSLQSPTPSALESYT